MELFNQSASIFWYFFWYSHCCFVSDSPALNVRSWGLLSPVYLWLVILGLWLYWAVSTSPFRNIGGSGRVFSPLRLPTFSGFGVGAFSGVGALVGSGGSTVGAGSITMSISDSALDQHKNKHIHNCEYNLGYTDMPMEVQGRCPSIRNLCSMCCMCTLEVNYSRIPFLPWPLTFLGFKPVIHYEQIVCYNHWVRAAP